MIPPRQSHLARICGGLALTLVACAPPPLPPSVPVTPARSSPPPRDRDTDCDGIADVDDACPAAPEDRDGFQDDDGCPDLDNDHDHIPDECDRCPDRPETYNGIDDEDGCPDVGLVRITQQDIRIIEHVFFLRGAAQIRPESRPLVEAIAATLRAHPDIERIAMIGHASSDEPSAQRLSERRAEAVRAASVALGMDPARVESHGYGSTRPLVLGTKPGELERNRRVDFQIMRVSGRDQALWDGKAIVDVPRPAEPPRPRELPQPPIVPCVLRVTPPLPSVPCRADPRRNGAPIRLVPRD
jgi:outer membrane protein OmpA-like peptidoglycan-associated protein